MTDYFSLPTEPRLLRRRFYLTRETLLGVALLRYRLEKKHRPFKLSFWTSIFSSPTDAKVTIVFNKTSWLRKVLFTFISLIAFGSFFIGAITFVPDIYYQLWPAKTKVSVPMEAASPLGGNYQAGIKAEPVKQYSLPYDASLPDGDWLIINQIGVRTRLLESTNANQALTKGVWLDSNYGKPGQTNLPIILAAHRFGYKWWWQSNYWKLNSFYRLPKTKPGTLIEIISHHRRWQYEIYKAEEGEKITDYNADLILYTCKFLNSPVRYIRYARLIDPTRDSQSI